MLTTKLGLGPALAVGQRVCVWIDRTADGSRVRRSSALMRTPAAMRIAGPVMAAPGTDTNRPPPGCRSVTGGGKTHLCDWDRHSSNGVPKESGQTAHALVQQQRQLPSRANGAALDITGSR